MRRLLLALPLLLAACGGGGGNPTSGGCNGFCQINSPQRLEVADVQQVIAQAVAEAQAQNIGATIAVVDRVGNVLAVFKMSNAVNTVTVSSQRNTGTGLDGLAVVPSTLAAIAKAVTGAYLSSEGNAFSTRTASQIVQEHFDPGELGTPGGPLFGVQFSSLPCSDFNTSYPGGGMTGPNRSPLGLSADPGGFPLYKNGTVVGGVGIAAAGLYSLDLNISAPERYPDELIAMAATAGFDAPSGRRADTITVGGASLRYTDVELGNTATGGRNTLNYGAAAASGALVAVTGYTAATPAIIAGTFFGQAQSGYAPATEAAYAGLDAFELVTPAGTPRYPARAGTDGLLSANEVSTLLASGIAVANRTRAQIRQPLNSQMRGSVVVVDTNGAILGVLRTLDAPVFGTDVALQKARTAMFFSSAGAGAAIQAAGSVTYLTPQGAPGNTTVQLAGYAQAMNSLIGPNALNGTYAYSARAIGNLERPFFPDGIDGNSNGPLSKPYAQWSPFSTGLQLDFDYEQIGTHVFYVAGASATDVTHGPGTAGCAGTFGPATIPAPLGDGLQVFAGGVPIYRGNTLVGGIGTSGDGIDQDDMVAFLGLANAGKALGTINNAPPAMRIDQAGIQGQNLRYVECPQGPFLDSTEQSPCDGL